jgi:CHASE2 domain-containing sensor protein
MEGKVPASIFQDRVVLIGSYAPSLKDMLPTPINVELRRMHGIEIFAQTISQILSSVLDDRPLVRPWSEPWISIWILSFGLSIYFAIVNLKRRHWWLGIALILSLTIILLIWSYISFLRGLFLSKIIVLLKCSA